MSSDFLSSLFFHISYLSISPLFSCPALSLAFALSSLCTGLLAPFISLAGSHIWAVMYRYMGL